MVLVTYGQDVSLATGAGTSTSIQLQNQRGATLRAASVTPTGTASQGPMQVTLNVSDSASGFVVFLTGGWVRIDANSLPDIVSWTGNLPCESRTATQRLNVQARNNTGSTFAIAIRWAVDHP